MMDALLQKIRQRMGSVAGSVAGSEGPALDIRHVDLMEQGARMADWLPYRSYLRNERVFVQQDSLGFMLELMPQTGANEDTVERLKGVYARLTTDATLQVHLYASPQVRQGLKDYAALRSTDADADRKASAWGGRSARNDNVFRQMARKRFAHLARGSREPLIPGTGFLVRDFRLLVSVTVPGNIHQMGQLEHLLDIRDGLRSTFEAARFPSRVMNVEDMLALVNELLNPARQLGMHLTPPEYNELQPLNEQCVQRDTVGDWSEPTRVRLASLAPTTADATQTASSGLSFESGVELRFLSVQKAPRQFNLWGMGGLVGDMYQDSLQIPCPFMVTMGVHVPDQKSMTTQAVVEKGNADKNAKSDWAAFAPSTGEKAQDWQNAMKALDAGGKLVWNYHQVVLFARPGEAKRAESALRDVWRSRGFELSLDAFIHKVALLQSLPMTLSKPFLSDLERLRRMNLRTSGNTVQIAPLIAEAKGTGTPTLLGLGRRGQLTTLDFFDNRDGGKSVAIVGSTGSGKSTLLQEIAAAYASKGAKVRVFEAGRSFERMCERIGGEFIRFSGERRICVNPFSMVSEQREVDGELCGGIDDDVAMLVPLLAKMASPQQPLDSVLLATLSTVIKQEYQTHGRSMTVTHVMRRYAQGRLDPERPVDQRFFDMADMLRPFTQDGPYAHYFEGQATLDFKNDFTVFEMQELSANPHLRGVVQMILLYRITQEMLEERQRQKLFIMDEAKEALAGNGPDDRILAEFLEKLYLRVRKYNGSAITATQDVAHYFSSAYGASIWNQSDFILMGRQSENSIEAVARGQAIKLDEGLRRLLGSIGGGGGHFKEWYVHSQLFKGVIRLVIDPRTLLLYSNRPEDNQPLDAELAKGRSLTEAIEAVLRQRGVQEAQ